MIDYHCARCGSSATFEDCWQCHGDGYTGHDCGDDTCCCLEPDDNMSCDVCNGTGGFYVCLSSADWCNANPLPGREKVRRGEVERFEVEEAASGK